MKRLDGSYKNIMVTNFIMNQIKKELVDNIIIRIETCTFKFDFENHRIFEKWIERLNLDELSHLKLYGDYFGYVDLAKIIDDAINEYAEEI